MRNDDQSWNSYALLHHVSFHLLSSYLNHTDATHQQFSFLLFSVRMRQANYWRSRITPPMNRFPSTSWELLSRAARRGDGAATARNEFAERYYGAVRAYIAALTRGASHIDDLTQRFFEAVVLSGTLLARADHEKGHFRQYLKRAIRNFLIGEHRQQSRLMTHEVHLDGVDGWSLVAVDASPSPDDEMMRAWAQSLVTMALSQLERVCDEKHQREHFEMFVRRYVDDPDHPPSWTEVGAPFGLDEKTARNRTETVARRFRSLLRQLIASDIGAGEDVNHELQAVLAVL
jgi:RNA polymerase sigma factor (sigma-70 family)